MFKGSLVALITPFRDGKVDEKAFQPWSTGTCARARMG
jgi:4-hydroxy-tetrahydrodipicolinate synthase